MFGQSKLKSYVAIHVTVRHMMNDLPHRPPVFSISCVELSVIQALHRTAHFLRDCSDIIDCSRSLLGSSGAGPDEFSNWVSKIHLPSMPVWPKNSRYRWKKAHESDTRSHLRGAGSPEIRRRARSNRRQR